MRLIATPRFGEHTPPPGHPERPERAEVFDQVAAAFRDRGGIVDAPRLATRDELIRVHTAEYVDEVLALAGTTSMLDADTFTSPESVEIARLAAGAAIDAAAHAWRTGERAAAFVRPPGHHAEPDRAMGFCLFNNIALAAAALRANGVARVAIVDFDVHHGNGTQHAFYADPAVLFISSHQFPYYPGTGAVDETGYGPGKGFTINVPLPAGTADAQFTALYETRVVQALDGYRPEIILVSAGFDAHERDPLGGLRVTTDGFRRIVSSLNAAAARLCGGRIAYITEGGYHLGALREGLEIITETESREG